MYIYCLPKLVEYTKDLTKEDKLRSDLKGNLPLTNVVRYLVIQDLRFGRKLKIP